MKIITYASMRTLAQNSLTISGILMTAAFLLLLSCSLVTTASGAPSGTGTERLETDADLILGEWTVTGAEVGGKQMDAEFAGKIWTFSKDSLKAEIVGDPKNPDRKHHMTFTYELSPGKDPKQMVLKLEDAAGQVVLNRAIYQIEDGVFKICMSFNSRAGVAYPFPKDFETKMDDELTSLFTLKRPKR